MSYEYKVIPAPRKPERIRGVKGTEDRFAATVSNVMNELAAEGWEFQRTEVMMCEGKSGMIHRGGDEEVTLMVFRREASGKPVLLARDDEGEKPRGLTARRD